MTAFEREWHTEIGPPGRLISANRRLGHWFRLLGWERVSATGLLLRATTAAPDVEGAAEDTLAKLRQAVPDDPELDSDDWLFRGIKFARLLPPHLAADTLRARIWDDDGARRLLREPVRWVRFAGA
ncbi:MAG: hypothetical protein EA398_16515 [Deltaproteobacteria bacterium]|nr:MAG: hypothetical protein EA398_16515 [Deltaproteobacteria bacterium]